MKEKDILYENGKHWVTKSKAFSGFEVYQDQVTHAVRVARIGFTGPEGLERAKKEADRRESKAK